MQAWENFLAQQERIVGAETVAKWLRPLKIVHFDACNLYLEAKDAFQLLWFEEHFRDKIKDNLLNNNQKQIRVHLTVADSAGYPTPSAQSEQTESTTLPQEPSVTGLQPVMFKFDEKNAFATLDQFIFAENNQLVQNVIIDVISHQKDVNDFPNFNPIYLFGESGVGKTHLLMGINKKLNELGVKALYVRAETFTEHVVNAIRSGEMHAFRRAYRSVDTLLIDDVQIFSRKGATQEELFHTFNSLHIEGKQIILSADIPPKELKDIEPRLVSRFEWGIALQIAPLPREKLHELLISRSQFLECPLNEEVNQFLLNTFSTPKTLMRALDAILLRAHLSKESAFSPPFLTIEKVKHSLSDLIESEKEVGLTPQQLIKIVADHFGIRSEDVLGKSQSRECALPRKMAMFFCRTELELPFMRIGEIFDRDHSTVMTSVRYIQKLYDARDPEISATIIAILKYLQRQLGWNTKSGLK